MQNRQRDIDFTAFAAILEIPTVDSCWADIAQNFAAEIILNEKEKQTCHACKCIFFSCMYIYSAKKELTFRFTANL